MPLRVRDFMSTPVIATTPDATAVEAYRLMLDRVIGGLPVLEGDELVGVVTVTDLRDVDEATPVGEIMSTDVVTVTPDQSLFEAAELLADHNIARLPVLSQDDQLVGIVSRANIVKAIADEEQSTSIIAEARAARKARRGWVRRRRVTRGEAPR